MGKWGQITVFIGDISYNYITLLITIIWAHLVVNHLLTQFLEHPSRQWTWASSGVYNSSQYFNKILLLT